MLHEGLVHSLSFQERLTWSSSLPCIVLHFLRERVWNFGDVMPGEYQQLLGRWPSTSYVADRYILLCQVKPECGVIVLGNQQETCTNFGSLKNWQLSSLPCEHAFDMFVSGFWRAIALPRILSSGGQDQLQHNTPKVSPIVLVCFSLHPKKSNIDTRKGHIKRSHLFQTIHASFGYPC